MRSVIIIIAALMSITSFAAPNFVTASMMKRNGLTDAQYQSLWAIGKNPTIDIGTARDWMFRADRYQNVTNWLDIIGKTNNFAALSYDLQDKNFKLSATNIILVATNHQLRATCETLAEQVTYCWDGWTNQIAQTESYSNLYNIVSVQAQAATAKIQSEIADLESKIEKYEEYKTKYPLFKTLWNALINDAQERIKILQALT